MAADRSTLNTAGDLDGFAAASSKGQISGVSAMVLMAVDRSPLNTADDCMVLKAVTAA
ncbi:hypothetical protein [Paenibacillus borealis]|nr:hypothetical protein [Paenibacillus borealis]